MMLVIVPTGLCSRTARSGTRYGRSRADPGCASSDRTGWTAQLQSDDQCAGQLAVGDGSMGKIRLMMPSCRWWGASTCLYSQLVVAVVGVAGPANLAGEGAGRDIG